MSMQIHAHFGAIFHRKSRNNVIEDEVTMTCAVLPSDFLVTQFSEVG
jgi:hypothetical protein